MIEIDASVGGGQLLRTAVAISAITLQPVSITGIRAARKKPGLMPQHLAGLRAAASFCDADMEGAAIGSTEVTFVPKSHSFSDKEIDIGTAGSIPLLMQFILPIVTFADKPIKVEISGGTAGKAAPTIEYTKFVTLPVLRYFGVLPPKITVVKQGFYPKGGGSVIFEFIPSTMLRSRMLKPGEPAKVSGVSVCGGLPDSVARRQADAAKRVLVEGGFRDVSIESTSVKTDSPGTSITLWTAFGETVMGSCSIGEMGKPAEEVGRDAASRLLASMKSGRLIDYHMADQVIPFMALARGRSEVTVERVTEHMLTNISVTERMLGVKFRLDENSGLLSVDGMGFRRQ